MTRIVIDGVRVRSLDTAEPERRRSSKVNGQDARLMPCPSRGTHHRLTDCWSCWSDVMRAAALEPEVLATAGWQPDSAGEDQSRRALGRITPTPSTGRGPSPRRDYPATLCRRRRRFPTSPAGSGATSTVLARPNSRGAKLRTLAPRPRTAHPRACREGPHTRYSLARKRSSASSGASGTAARPAPWASSHSHDRRTGGGSGPD